MTEENSFKSELNPALEVVLFLQDLQKRMVLLRIKEKWATLYGLQHATLRMITPVLTDTEKTDLEKLRKKCNQVQQRISNHKPGSIFSSNLFKCFDEFDEELLIAKHKHGLYLRAKEGKPSESW